MNKYRETLRAQKRQEQTCWRTAANIPASTRRISLCIFCISGSTPDNDASVMIHRVSLQNDNISTKLSTYEHRNISGLKFTILQASHLCIMGETN